MEICESMPDVNETFASLPISERKWARIVQNLELSPQQARITKYILRCWSDQDIADEMDISKATVRVYVKRIFDRLGVRNRQMLTIRIWTISERMKQ